MSQVIAVDDIQTTQLEPFGRPGAPTKLLVEFTISGGAREFVEVYATTDVGAFDSALVGKVPIHLHSNEYSIVLNLVAGMIFEIRCCPRTTTNGVPDKIMDDEPWENQCNTVRIVTKVDPGSFPKPVLFSTIPRHATLRRKNNIRIQWESPRTYTFYQVRWADERSGFRDRQIDEIESGIGGVFTLESTLPGIRYSFKVNGLMRTHSETGSSGFTDPVFVTAAPNTRSLREFLGGVDARGGVRGLMPANISSLRVLLGV